MSAQKAQTGGLEELREKADAMMKEKEAKEKIDETVFLSQVDSILDKFTETVSKYPEEIIHQKADNELNRLYGAFLELYACFRASKVFLLELKDYGIETTLKDIENRFQKFIQKGSKNSPPSIYLDYCHDLDCDNALARAEQFILKEAGFFLHHFIKKFEILSPFLMRAPIHTTIGIIPDDIQQEFPRVYKSLNGKTLAEIFTATQLYASAMINDFRLQHFKNNEN